MFGKGSAFVGVEVKLCFTKWKVKELKNEKK